MTCPSCRTVNAPGVTICARCGQPLAAAGPGGRKGLSITAMVLGIASYPLMCAFGAGLVTAIAAIVCGIVALVKARRYPVEYGGKGFAIAGLVTGGVVFLFVPIWAAIAIPSLLRARMSANEAGAMGDIRTVISAEATYASANRGYFDKLECLAQPQSCIPGSTETVPMVGAPITSEPTRRGYQFELHLGPAAPPDSAGGVSQSSVTGFAYVAVPVKAGSTGNRSFCGDENGVIRASAQGEAPTIVGGKCPETWPTL